MLIGRAASRLGTKKKKKGTRGTQHCHVRMEYKGAKIGKTWPGNGSRAAGPVWCNPLVAGGWTTHSTCEASSADERQLRPGRILCLGYCGVVQGFGPDCAGRRRASAEAVDAFNVA